MLSILANPWAWLVLVAVLGASNATTAWFSYGAGKNEAAADKLAESETARLRERAAQINHQRIADEEKAAHRSTVARLASELERVRNRPDRLPEASRPACAGSSGAELSGRDAAFLIRLAGRADDLRAALDACQKREAVNDASPRPR